MGKPIIFISHISEEAKLAAILKAHVEADFIDTVSVYVSSDTESISAGENWLTSIDVPLSEACIELILCSKASINRGWVNFEAGAGWMRHIPVVPVCHNKASSRRSANAFPCSSSCQGKPRTWLAINLPHYRKEA